MKQSFYLFFITLVSLALMSCSKSDIQPTSTGNPSKYITDSDKRKMITSLTDLDGGRIYTMNYTEDYCLQEAIDAGTKDLASFCECVTGLLFDVQYSGTLSYGAECSAFAATVSGSGEYMLGRNYDYCHTDGGVEDATALVVLFTAPENGKKSVGFVDAYFLGLRKGFYTDGTTDISTLVLAPYFIVDGMNEDGLAFSSLALDGKGTDQNEVGKQDVYVSIAMRAVLDRCSTVDQAIEYLKGYNMRMKSPVNTSLHFMLADAGGKYAVVEWSFKNPLHVDENSVPDLFMPLQADTNRYVTNFYVDPRLKDCIYGGRSSHGRDRYNTLRDTIEFYSHILTEQQAKSLLKAVSQNPDPDIPTSHTQWSNVYNMSERTVRTAILQEYGKWYEFTVEKLK